MSIKGIIDAERWGFAKAMLMYRSGYPAVEHNDSLDRIEAAYQKEYAEWQEGDERLRRMHEEHLGEYDKRIAELEAQLPKTVTPIDGKCPNCGGWCGWNYCKYCGSKLNWSVSWRK